ncbi:MAG: rRNA maturation RNase YbeY [Candidatus Omnitrophica bacterium]|nr:rRNA maturation RNase YbeY [Candidatus Omnitrophota bacterium]
MKPLLENSERGIRSAELGLFTGDHPFIPHAPFRIRSMVVEVINTQRELPVNTAGVARLARLAIRRLRIRTAGGLTIAFIGPRRMRILNKRFLRHDRSTDVLSFRYDRPLNSWPRARGRQQTVGEILIAPRSAHTYARRHSLSYSDELARYVVHGLLHWAGHEDRTTTQQRRMRALEDWLLRLPGADPTRPS